MDILLKHWFWGSGRGPASIQTSDLTITDISSTEMDLSWTRGNGNMVLILCKAVTNIDSSPVDSNSYSANSVFGSGSQIGTGNYVIYSGSGTSMTVTGLTANTQYFFRAYEFTGTTYLTTITTNIASDKSFTTEFQAVIDYAVAQSYSMPALRWASPKLGLVDLDMWVTKRKSSSSWSTQDVVYFFKLGDSTLSSFSLINYKNPGTYNGSLVNSPTYGVNGWTMNGTNSYIDTGFAPSAGVNLTLNDSGAIVGISAGTEQLNLNDFAAAGASANPSFGLQSRRTSNGAAYNLSNSYATNSSNAVGISGLWQLKRTASNAIGLFLNGVSRDADTNASTSRPTVNVYLGNGNINGTPGTSTDRTYNVFEMGASQTGKESKIYSAWVGFPGANLNEPDNIFIEGTRAYVTSTAGDAVEIIDISDPTNPKHLSKIVNGQGGASLDGPLGIFKSGNYLYVTCIDGNNVAVIDVTDPLNPLSHGNIANGAGGAALASPWNIDIVGTLAYVTSNHALEILDISTPATPTHVGTLSDGGGVAPYLSTPLAIKVVGNYAYICASGDSAFEVVDVSTPSAPTHAGSLVNGAPVKLQTCHGLAISGNYAYVCSRGSDAIEIIDISTPTSPAHVSSIVDGAGGALLNGPTDIKVVGNYAYIAVYDGSAFEILDISTPSAPTHVSSISNGSGGAELTNADDIWVSGDFAYITARYGNAVEVINIYDVSNPIHVGKISNGG